MVERCWCDAEVYRDDKGAPHCSASPYHDPVWRPANKEPRVLYLAGPMTGIPECNYPLFNREAARLRRHGFTVHNPAEIGDVGSQYSDLMKKDIRLILESEGIAVLEGWWNSRGARLETHIAGVLGYPIRSVDEWVSRSPVTT